MTKLIPFDWHKYIEGYIPTFNIERVKIIGIVNSNSSLHEEYPLHIIMENSDKEHAIHTQRRLDGTHDLDFYPTLFLEDKVEEKTIWINVYEHRGEISYGDIYDSENKVEEAHAFKKPHSLGILKITFTEEDLIKGDHKNA